MKELSETELMLISGGDWETGQWILYGVGFALGAISAAIAEPGLGDNGSRKYPTWQKV